jgi:N-acetyl-1-D-myo-inositol-2-amino-2-deoxy-alpha-D-glucopyranoside deacetylase
MTDARPESDLQPVDPERVLFVHAHPDDETITTGGTLATLVDRGAAVTVVTCTRGERGEVVAGVPVPESAEALAAVREAELRAALGILGVTDHRFLGGADARWGTRPLRRYTDSGMRWGASGAEPSDELDPASLTAAEFGEVAADIAAVILAVRPDVVVSYDHTGGYGHPDHVRAHEAARRAADVYGVPFYAVQPEVAAAASAGSTLSVDVTPVFERKRGALRAYPSQLTVDGEELILSGGQRQPIGRVERFARVHAADSVESSFSELPLLTRVVAVVIAAVIGAAAGALFTAYNQSTTSIAGIDLWIGAIVAILSTAALFAGFRLAFGTRIVAAAAAIGLIVMVGIFSFASASGTILIPLNGPGITWAVGPVVAAVVVLAWPRIHRRAPARIAHS